MLASVISATLVGIDGQPVTVEVHVSSGLPSYHVVGLPDTAVRESRERVRAALLSSGLAWPQQRVTVNLAPGDIRKTGAGLELAVALGLLLATGGLPAGALDGVGVLGELGLDGSVRPVPGMLALVDGLTSSGITAAIVPAANVAEASLIEHVQIRGARRLDELHECLKGKAPWPPPEEPPQDREPDDDEPLDLGEVRGLAWARRALEVAAAGGHHLLMTGPPGAGKTMLAHRLATILPGLTPSDALEATRLHSIAGRASRSHLLDRPPFRAPHHSSSVPALVGGGSGRITPGEATLAHRGVLFLDELGEFPPRALDALRQPLEERVVRIARQGLAVRLPADFLLVACSNPCPCGLGPPRCTCRDRDRDRYRRRLSAPLLDRFDLRLAVRPPESSDLPGETSAVVRERVMAAVARQRARLHHTPWRTNAHIPANALDQLAPLTHETLGAWHEHAAARQLTGRGAARVRRVARTLADLADQPEITASHIALASLLREDVP